MRQLPIRTFYLVVVYISTKQIDRQAIIFHICQASCSLKLSISHPYTSFFEVRDEDWR